MRGKTLSRLENVFLLRLNWQEAMSVPHGARRCLVLIFIHSVIGFCAFSPSLGQAAPTVSQAMRTGGDNSQSGDRFLPSFVHLLVGRDRILII